jgi:hypothetical protein
MKLYEPITKESIIDEVDRICNTTANSYKTKDKIARVNEGLDQYWFLAAESAPQGTLDDTSKTSAPIETQNLVSGTNAYKISSFTNKVLQILKVSVLDADAYEHDLIYIDFDDIEDFDEFFDTAVTGIPEYWTKLGDYIYIANTPDYSETNGLKCYVNRELSKFSYVTFTTTHATETINATAHGLSNGDVVLLVSEGTLPAGYSEDTAYYVVAKADNTFQVSLTIGGSAVAITTDGTGNHKFIKVSGEPGIPVIHHPYLSRYAAYKYMKSDHPNFSKTREDLAMDKRDIQDYWQSVVRPGKTIIETNRRAFR